MGRILSNVVPENSTQEGIMFLSQFLNMLHIEPCSFKTPVDGYQGDGECTKPLKAPRTELGCSVQGTRDSRNPAFKVTEDNHDQQPGP